MKKIITAIIDNIAGDVAGQLMLFPSEPAAIRMFGDVANDNHPNNMVARHIQDFSLVQLGILDVDNSIITERRTILTGTQWKLMNDAMLAAQQTTQEEARK